MPFGSFKSQVDVAKAYQITLVMGHFVEPKPYPVNEAFAKDLEFVLQNLAVRISEASIRELMIAPVLKEVWKAYSDTFLMWVNVPFEPRSLCWERRTITSRANRRWAWFRISRT